MSREALRGPLEPVSGDRFRRACGRFATGVAVASVLDSGGAPHGLTVNSFSSVSLEPPLVLICLGHLVAAIDVFRHATYFGLSVLAADQGLLSERFARPADDRFEGLNWQPGRTGVPLLTGVIATIECELRHRITAGDHDILVGCVVGTEINDGDPLTYFASEYRTLA